MRCFDSSVPLLGDMLNPQRHAWNLKGLKERKKPHSERPFNVLFSRKFRVLLLSFRRRHDERGVVSNHWRLDGLLNRLLRRKSKKTSKLLATGLCEGIHWWPVNTPHKGPVTRKILPFDDVIMVNRLANVSRLVAGTWMPNWHPPPHQQSVHNISSIKMGKYISRNVGYICLWTTHYYS